MFHVAYPRGQGPAFADLPPTLQPHVIAASAPPSDRLRTATLSGLIYFSLVGAVFALSSVKSTQVLVPPQLPPPGPTIIEESIQRFRITLPPIAGTHATGGGSESVAPTSTVMPAVDPVEPATGLPRENHALDPVGVGPGTTAAQPAEGIPRFPATGAGSGPLVHDFTATGLAVLRQVDPIYPDFARRGRIQGPVVLLMTVDEQGQPTQIQVLEGHPVFHEAAKQAARQWRFQPARLDGRPVSATFRLTLKFALR